MKELLARFECKQDEFHLIDSNGCCYDDMQSLIQCGILEFCGCSCPSQNLDYIKRELERIASKQIYGNNISDSEQFFQYWADANELTEHGFCLPGWLTEKGKALIELIKLSQQEEMQ